MSECDNHDGALVVLGLDGRVNTTTEALHFHNWDLEGLRHTCRLDVQLTSLSILQKRLNRIRQQAVSKFEAEYNLVILGKQDDTDQTPLRAIREVDAMPR